MNRTGSGERRETTGSGALVLLVAAALLSGCGATRGPAPDAETASAADTMTMAEMRLDEAGGPSRAALPVGVVSPVASPDQVTPSPRALTDAGPNTPLGKQWIFTRVDGYEGVLPGPPTDAGILLSRGNGRVVGRTSCNPLTAAFEIDIYEGTLSFRNIVNGSAMCSRANADTEDAIIEALMAVDAFRLDGNTLLLLSKGKVVAELVTP